MPRIHEFDLPEPGDPVIEILELSGVEIQRLAEQAAKDHPLEIVKSTLIEAKLKRLQCIRGYQRFELEPKPDRPRELAVDLHVSKGARSHDILDAMSARELSFLDAAIDNVHEVRADEMRPFFGTKRTKEV